MRRVDLDLVILLVAILVVAFAIYQDFKVSGQVDLAPISNDPRCACPVGGVIEVDGIDGQKRSAKVTKTSSCPDVSRAQCSESENKCNVEYEYFYLHSGVLKKYTGSKLFTCKYRD